MFPRVFPPCKVEDEGKKAGYNDEKRRQARVDLVKPEIYGDRDYNPCDDAEVFVDKNAFFFYDGKKFVKRRAYKKNREDAKNPVGKKKYNNA